MIAPQSPVVVTRGLDLTGPKQLCMGIHGAICDCTYVKGIITKPQARCTKIPLTSHLYFYKEKNSFLSLIVFKCAQEPIKYQITFIVKVTFSI